ncbi:hypothetical protein GPECTOR_33g673 [Gonium pectorale]|uniref:ERD4 protein n=1 Tax=Gonium pectorale TaxID=33097 RepID=A0A150GD56_GONPE|nr:hypothetical protein GPECTOR_33g673 [Gonium pectorale]|eukprot:KXZ47791.1 hypothetical protein GPECTOR_33g673 [Gonium pectorale]
MAAGSAAVLTNFLTNFYVCLGCFGAFCILRLRPWARRFFASRRYAKDIDLKPKRLPNGLFSWILPVVTYPEEDIIDEAGLDCAMYLRILRFGLGHFFILTIWCIIVVLPPNMTSNEIERLLAQQASSNSTITNTTDGDSEVTTIKSSSGQEFKFTNFDRYSLSNIPAGSPKMWSHLISVYFVVLFTLWRLWRFNKESVLLRLLFLGNAKRGGPSHTVLVTDIPAAVSKALKEEKAIKRSASMRQGGLQSMGSLKDGSSVNADSCYIELQGGPADAEAPAKGLTTSPSGLPDSPRLPTSTKSVSFGDSQPSKQIPLPPLATAPTMKRAAVNGTVVTATASPFADAKSNAAAAVAISAAADGTVAADSGVPTPGGGDGVPPTTPRKRSGVVGKLLGAASDKQRLGSVGSGYTLVADVDPKYAATGGKLELQRVGLTGEDILKELEVIEPEDLLKSLPPNLGVDTRPLPPSRRNTKRFTYDLKSDVLDPVRSAKEKLKSGMTPQQMVAREFSMVYAPNSIAAVNMILDTAELEPLAEEYNAVAEQLEDYLEMAKLRLKLRKGLPPKQVTILCARYTDMEYVKQFKTKWFVKVDAVEWWLERMRYLREKIKEQQDIAARKVAPSAFVTFNTRMAQAVGANSLHSHDENAWRLQNAPAPFEVIWKNLSMTMPIKSGRLYILWAAFWAMTIFFMVPITAIQAIIEVPKLAQVPVLGKIVTAPGVRQILEAIVPGLALKIFLLLVPIILRFMAILSGSTSESEVDFGVVKRFFLFQVIVVFFGNIIAGSFFNQLKQWVNNPSSVIPTLGKSIPMTSTFYVTYLLINGLAVKSIAFIRLPNFIIFWILSKFAGSPRARQRMWMYQYTNNGTTVVDHTIALLIGTTSVPALSYLPVVSPFTYRPQTFSCINPIICPAALVYFLVNYIGERYNNIYVFRREYESGGRLWATVYNQVMAGLYIMQITMLGLLSIKKFPFSPVMFPLIFFSISSHIGTLQLYSRPWSVTALHNAAEMDMLEADQRRMNLLAAAKEERKKVRERKKKAYEELVRAAKAEDRAPPPPDPDMDAPLVAGKAEKLLLESLQGDGFAMNNEEKKEIAEMYKNPAFKVQLDDVERLAKLAAEVQSRLPRLNEWVTLYAAYRRETHRRKLRGETDMPPPPKMPEDLTIFDEDPNLVDSDDEASSQQGAATTAKAAP